MYIIDKEASAELLTDLGAKDFEIEVSEDGYCEVSVNDTSYLITEPHEDLITEPHEETIDIKYEIEMFNEQEAREYPTLEFSELPSFKSFEYSNLEKALNHFLELNYYYDGYFICLFLEVGNSTNTLLEDTANGHFLNIRKK